MKQCEICKTTNVQRDTRWKTKRECWYNYIDGTFICPNCYRREVLRNKFGTKECECGCGELIPKLNAQFKPYRYKNHHYQKKIMVREGNHNWKNGRRKHSNGYVLILKPDHPFADSHGYVMEHRLVMEEHLGRYLTKDEEIHHINEIKTDNRIENLLVTTKAEHTKIHQRQNQYIKNQFGTFKVKTV